MKKVFQFAFVAIAAIAVAACNGKDDPNKGGKENGGKQNGVSIKIDGDFADWADASIASCDMGEIDLEAAAYPYLHVMKGAADSKNVYLYFEYELVEGQTASAIDILINSDNDATTGFTSWIWSKEGCGWDFMLESEGGFLDGATAIRDMSEDMNVYKFLEGSGQDAWDAGSKFEQQNASDFFANKGVVKNGVAYFECSIQRSVINANKKGALALGVTFTNVVDGDWVTAGILPQSEDGIGTAELFEIALP